MTRLLDRLTGRQSEERLSSIDDYIWAVNQYAMTGGVTTSLGGGPSETVGNSFVGFSAGAHGSNGVVFSCMLVRQLVFSAARFRFQRLRDGKPSDMFGSRDLGLLERPAPGETTQDLLSRMIQDADLAGNAYYVKDTPLTRLGGDGGGSQLLRLRPDWVEIVAQKRMRPTGQLGWRRRGYIYTEGGINSDGDPVLLGLDEIAHFAPIPDPLAVFRGMSWLTPVVREIEADRLMTRHKRRFYEHGATPNMIVRHPTGADREKVMQWVRRMDSESAGIDNAYKTLHLYPGADATVVGKDMRQVDFKAVQGAGETRIAAAAGVPPVIVGLSEGLEAATYSNYAQARRRFADGTIHPLWQNMAGTMETIVAPPGPDARLWYDSDDIPFLREDEKDAAEITQTRATTLATLVREGFTPESAAKFMQTSDDFRVLEHTGLFSVQLQPPGSGQPEASAPTEAPTDDEVTE